ncbi:hypothetical protein ACFLY9_02180 [Patescibacteria group bacterium]
MKHNIFQTIILKAKYIYLKASFSFERRVNPINQKLPRILKITKYSLVTTVISVILGTGVVVAQDSGGQCSNLEMWTGACDTSIEKGSNDYMVQWLNKQFEGTLVYDSTTGSYIRQGGLLATMSEMQGVVLRNTDQVSGFRYMANTLEDAKLITPAYAQATGYTTLQPVLVLWKKVRNLTLSFVIVVGLIIAIMILFRVRSGQGYVSLLSSLPKLVVTIVLILSSYAIGGLAIDIGNVITKFAISRSVFVNDEFIPGSDTGGFLGELIYDGSDTRYPLDWEQATNKSEYDLGEVAADSGNTWRTMNIFRLMAGMTNFSNWSADCAPNCRISDIIRTPTGYIIIDEITTGLESLGELPDSLLEAILNIYLAIVSFKIFFMLVQAFAELIMRILSAPLQFLGIPFTGFTSFMSWGKSVLASSLTFPATFILMFVAAYFSGQNLAPWWFRQGLVEFDQAPEMLTHTVSDVAFVGNLVSIGILLMIPNIKKLIEQMLTVTPTQIEGAAQGLKGFAQRIPVVGAAMGFLGA